MLIFLYGILGFIILVFVHELGHFLVARAFGIKVEEFAIGMGPTIVQKKWGETVYKICIIPLGGYCAIKGQSDFGTTDRNTDKDSFFGKSPWVRFCVVAAGPIFSFLLGYFLISSAISIQGENHLRYTLLDPPKNSSNFRAKDEVISVNGEKIEYWDQIQMALFKNIGKPNTIVVKRDGKLLTISNYMFDLSEKNLPNSDFALYYTEGPLIIMGTAKDSPANRIGIQVGDVLVSANGTSIRSKRDLDAVLNTNSPTIKLVLHRYENAETLVKKDLDYVKSKLFPFHTVDVNIVPQTNKDNKKSLGVYLFPYVEKDITSRWEHKDLSFLASLSLGWKRSLDMIVINAKGIWQMLHGNKAILDSLSGPVKIFYEVGRVSEANGIISFFNFIGIISLALALSNLLPFPALDGGHMVIAVLEGILRRPINAKILNVIQTIGVILLLTLFIVITIRDIMGFF